MESRANSSKKILGWTAESSMDSFSCVQCKMAFIKGPELRSHIHDQHKGTDIKKSHRMKWNKIIGIESCADEDKAICEPSETIPSEEKVNTKDNLSISYLEKKPNMDVCAEDSIDKDDTVPFNEDCFPHCEPGFVSEANKEGKFSCDQCKAVVSKIYNVREHKLIQHEVLRFQCRKCANIFINQMEMKNHKSNCLEPERKD